METIFFEKISEIIKNKEEIEKKLNVKITIRGKSAIIEGDTLDEYEASLILNAISFGFSAKQALSLLNEDIAFKTIHIRDFTRRKNLEDVRSRLIGSEGKTKHTIEEITGCKIIVKESEIGIIAPAEKIDNTITAIINIIRGTKQANAYHFLERMNAAKKTLSTDLGLKQKKEEE